MVLVGGPSLKNQGRFLFHWHRGWGIPATYIFYIWILTSWLASLMVPNFGEGTWHPVICGGFMGETKNLKPYKIHPGSPKTKLCPLVVGSPESMDHPKDQPLCLVDWTSRVHI